MLANRSPPAVGAARRRGGARERALLYIAPGRPPLVALAAAHAEAKGVPCITAALPVLHGARMWRRARGGGGGGASAAVATGRGVPQQVRRDVDRRKQQLRLDIPATNTIALQIPRVPLETPLGIHRRRWRGPRLCAARCIVRCQETIAVRRGGSAWKHSVASRMLRVRALVDVVQTSNVRSAVRNNLRSQPRRSTPHAPHSTALQWTLRSTHSTP
jgi:hypothetical protein